MFQLPGFYPILDTDAAARCGLDVIRTAEALLSAGVRILQFRHKGFCSRDVFQKMDRIASMCRDASVPFVVNDRADLAALFGAVLHLGQDDLPPTAARRVTGPNLIFGFSTHNESQLRAALTEPVDYLALGPIFGTASKQNPDPIVGVAELQRLRALTEKPLVAIGGITLANARSVLNAGADSVAVIGDLIPAGGAPDLYAVRTRAEEWIRVTSG
jgi:thiamine-phosphate pyrophosphorylase